MKKTFLLWAILATNMFVYAQELTSFSLTKGTKLIYNVEQGTNEYQFIMNITELGKGVSFDWEMTAPVNKTGSVTITPDAMKSATALFNYFSGGTTTLAKETSAFVSRDAYTNIEKNKKVTLSANGINGTPETFEVLGTNESEKNGSIYLEYTRPVNEKDFTFQNYILENADGNKAIRVWKNAEFPLIIFMETNFKIYLTGIEQ